MRYVRFSLFLVLFFAAACAELSKQDCEQGAWQAIGQRDGARGRDATFVARHAESCGKHGIGVDAALWEQGRQQGLRVFCTPETQYQSGRDGRPLNDICALENLPVHRDAWDKGHHYYLLTQRIEALRSEIRDLRHAAVSEPDSSRGSLELEAFMLRMEIDLLLRQRRQYEAL